MLVMAVLVAFALLRQQMLGMDGVFFQRSLFGAKALVFYLAGDYARAARAYRDHFRNVLESGGRVADPTTNAIITGDLRLAERLARAQLEREPSAVEPLIALGTIALERGALDDAMDGLRRAIARSPDHLDALMLASVAHARAGRYGDAIDLANQAFRHHAVGRRLTAFLAVMATTGDLAQREKPERPLCVLAHYHRYLRIFDDSQARLAARYAEQAVAAGDRVADAYLTIGVVHGKRHRPDQALAAFARAIEVDPKHAEAYRRSAVIYGERGDDVRAYTMARAAFESAPADPFYIEPLDHFLMERLADPHQVVTILARALEVNPDNVRAHDRLGYAYGFIGDHGRSLAHYRRALALEPRNPALHEGLGWTLDRLGRADDAIVAYRHAVDIAPDRYQSHAALANAYHRRHKYPEAIAEYEAAFRLGKPSVETLASLCAMYHTTSQFQSAVRCFQGVLERDPSNALAGRLMRESVDNARLQGERR